MVQFQDVTKVYPGSIPAVYNINFQIEKGEFVFLIGPSGSGKTTLIKMLIRDEKPSRGRIFFDDDDITHINRAKIYKLRRQIGVIFQDFKLIPDKTAFENVAFAMEAAGKKTKEIKETVPYVLDIVGLSHRINSFPKQLSGGEQQRVAIARALANKPKILIADEPTGNLDPASAWDIVQILSKINNWGTTIIMSTHGTDIVNSLNKRVIQMENGNVVRDDNKGSYEFTRIFEDNVMSKVDETKDEEVTPTLKRTFKVNLTEKLQTDQLNPNADMPKKKSGGMLGKLFKFGRKHTDEQLQEVTEIDNTNISEETQDIEQNLIPQQEVETVEEQPEVEQETSEKNKDEAEEVSVDEVKNEDSNEEGSVEEDVKPKAKSTKKQKKLHLDLATGLSEKAEDLSKSKPKNAEEKQLKALLEKSKDITVDELPLDEGIKVELKSGGYNTVWEVILEGPDNLAKSMIIDQDEVVKVARAIEKILDL